MALVAPVPSSGHHKHMMRQPSGRKETCCVCSVDLASAKPYYRRNRICPADSQAPTCFVNGEEMRWCQQCCRFQALADFDDTKRTCRQRLELHNAKRRDMRRDNRQNAINGANARKQPRTNSDGYDSPNTSARWEPYGAPRYHMDSAGGARPSTDSPEARRPNYPTINASHIAGRQTSPYNQNDYSHMHTAASWPISRPQPRTVAPHSHLNGATDAAFMSMTDNEKLLLLNLAREMGLAARNTAAPPPAVHQNGSNMGYTAANGGPMTLTSQPVSTLQPLSSIPSGSAFSAFGPVKSVPRPTTVPNNNNKTQQPALQALLASLLGPSALGSQPPPSNNNNSNQNENTQQEVKHENGNSAPAVSPKVAVTQPEQSNGSPQPTSTRPSPSLGVNGNQANGQQQDKTAVDPLLQLMATNPVLGAQLLAHTFTQQQQAQQPSLAQTANRSPAAAGGFEGIQQLLAIPGVSNILAATMNQRVPEVPATAEKQQQDAS